MTGDKVVVDAVVHPCDLAAPNQVICAKDSFTHSSGKFARAPKRGIPGPWRALRGPAPAAA